MKFTGVVFAAILLATTSQVHAVCLIGDTQQCTVNGAPGIRQCNPHTHLFGPCVVEVDVRATVKIDWNAVHQTIDGFGTAEGGSPTAHLLYDEHDPQNSRNAQVLDLAFSQENGIGLTILRSEIAPALHPDKQTWNFTDTAQVGLMKAVVRRAGSATKLIGSVWSPPAWMKTNGNVNNCEANDQGQPINCVDAALKLENYQDFADVLSHYAGEYARANGINIYAVSIQNEPDNDEPWSSCRWTSAQIAAFLADYLRPTFAAHQIGAKVIAPETSNWDIEEQYLSETYNNPAATGRLDIAAAHLYGGDPSRVFQNALTHGKQIWQTEASLSNLVWDMGGALSWATTISKGLTDAQISAWIWWGLAGAGGDTNLIKLDDVNGHSPDTFSVSKTFWALGNFSKFVRPGFVRIETETTTGGPWPIVDFYLHTSAYKDPATGQLVIVAINASSNDINVKFDTVGFPGSSGSSVTPYITSATHDLAPLAAVSLANTVTIPAQSIVSYVSPAANISVRRPDGMILSTGNIYFTSHDAAGAHVFRTAQTSTPGQEIELYKEGPGNRFGDIVFAKIGDVYYGYFWATDSTGKSSVKRILLTGSNVATVLTPALNDIDIVNSHHNLATDGVSLYWQDVSSVKKMPIGGGAITTLDLATPNTPTAGVYLNNGIIIYASVAAVRYVPTSGTVISPFVRTIANADTTVTTILPVANGTYWGDRSGAIQLKAGATISTVQAGAGLVPTSIATNGYTAGGALVWTQCASTTCQTRFDFPAGEWVSPVASNALGASMNSSGSVFWGDDYGVHRLDF
jgi:O-glycosyl hydrolase